MTRRLLNLAALLSLALGLACAGMWLRGMRVYDIWLFRAGTRLWSVSSHGAGLLVRVTRDAPDPGPARWMSGRVGSGQMHGSTFVTIPSRDPPMTEWGFPGVRGSHGQTRLGVRDDGALWVAEGPPEPFPEGNTPLLPGWQVRVQWWVPVTAFGLPPLALYAARARRRLLRRRAAAEGRCASCGYDLRTTSGRCPECGTIAASPPAG